MNHRLAVASVFVSVGLAAAACSSDEATTEESTPAASESSETSSPSSEPMESETEMADPAAGLVGPGCADYAAANPDGPASVGGMAEAPVSEAASGNPLLKTLVAAVSGQLNPDVNLVSTLDSSEFTIFAPVDDAFAKLPADVVATLGTPEGAETLSTVLQYHVVAGRIEPDAIIGEQMSVTNLPITVGGTADAMTVNDANVICGGVQTANATVYLIDTVLMPPAS